MRLLACAAAALLGAGLILGELAFTRLFGYLYDSTRVFALDGLGAFGLAAGGFLAHRIGWHPRRRPTILAAGAALAGALTLSAAVSAASGFTTFLSSLPLGLPELIAAYVLFAVVGLALSALTALVPGAAGWCAAARFGGGAAAAVIFPALSAVVEPPTSALLAASLMALAALPAGLAAVRARPRVDADGESEGGLAGAALGWIVVALLALAPVVGFGAQLAVRWLRADPEKIVSPKPLFQSVGVEADGERVVHSAWDGHSRIDVTEDPRQPFYRWIYQDGAFTGRVIRSSGSALPVELLRQDIAYLPFLLPGGKDRVLIIGAGGGQEVAAAIAGGASEVVVADAAPALNSPALAELNGSLYARGAVRYVAEDARTHLRSAGGLYDLIFLTLAAAGSAQPAGASAGAGLLTIEAYAAYMNALKPDGRLVVQLRDQEEMLRSFSTAYQTWTRLGAGQV